MNTWMDFWRIFRESFWTFFGDKENCWNFLWNIWSNRWRNFPSIGLGKEFLDFSKENLRENLQEYLETYFMKFLEEFLKKYQRKNIERNSCGVIFRGILAKPTKRVSAIILAKKRKNSKIRFNPNTFWRYLKQCLSNS